MPRVFFLLLAFARLSGGKISEGRVDTTQDFVFLDRFCFESELGHLEFTIRYPTTHPVPSLLLYYDTPDQWHRAYTQLDTCAERVGILTNGTFPVYNNLVNLSPIGKFPSSDTKCVFEDNPLNTTQYVTCTGAKTFNSVRSRWWFIAVSTCNEKRTEYDGTKFDYKLVMTNGDPSDFFTYQFSFDQRYLLLITVIFVCVDTAVFIAAYIVGWQLTQRRLHHSVYRIYTHCIFGKTLALICYLVHYAVYSVNGSGIPTIEVCAQSVTYGTEIMFLLMLLVLSRGLNVTKMKLSKVEVILIAIYTIALSCSYFALHIWQVQGYDPALVYFYSESIPGKAIAILKLIACIFVLISCLLTIKEAPAKRWFYSSLLFFYTPWYFGTPMIVILGNYVLDNWVREEVVFLVDNCVTLYGFIIFLYLSWPSQANKNFPFHIRTTQVSDSFDPHVNYAASGENEDSNAPKHTPTLSYFEIRPPNDDLKF